MSNVDTSAEMRVSTDFPGGAGEIIKIDQQERTVHFRGTSLNAAWSTWWYFKITGIQAGETINLHQHDSARALLSQAVFSLDNKNWQCTPPGVSDDKKGIVYTQRIDGKEAWFAYYVPYLPDDTKAMIERIERACAFARKIELCKTEEGRPVLGLQISEPGLAGAKRVGIWIQARLHAWETGGSWFAQGLIDWLVSDDQRAKSLRKKADITIIPIMDVDGVFKGGSGKSQKPHDHARDWVDIGEPHWNSVRAAMGKLKAMIAAGKLDLFIDLHDPLPRPDSRIELWWIHDGKAGAVRREKLKNFVVSAKTECKLFSVCLADKGTYDGKPENPLLPSFWIYMHSPESVLPLAIEITIPPPENYKDNPPAHHLIGGKELGLAIERYFNLTRDD